MSVSVATIIAPQLLDEPDELLNKAKDSLEQAGGRITHIEELSYGIAYDLFFTDINQVAATTALENEGFYDFIVQNIDGESINGHGKSINGRRKKLLISDMDSTIITIECIDELADFAGVKDEVRKVTEKAMNGEIDFKKSLVERVRLLEGLPEEDLAKVYNERLQFSPGAKALVQTMRSQGVHCVLVSGGFTYFTDKVSKALGFHKNFANKLEIQDGKLTGKIIEPVLDQDAKLDILKAECKVLGISAAEVIAVGDGANDLPMLQAAGLGVAYHAKPKVKAEVHSKIDICDLRSLLYAQGYKQEEIMTDI